MPTPTINDVQAVEPILTQMLIGYMQDESRFVASRAFPSVPVDKDSGTYYIVTKKYFFMNDLKPRAPGGPFQRLNFGLETSTYATFQWAGEMGLPDETQANSQVPMELMQVALKRVAAASAIRKEVSWATDFMTLNVWATDDNNSTTDWDDFTSGDPVADILLASDTIGTNTGLEANTIVMGKIVRRALVNHPDIIDRVKYTQRATLATMDEALSSVLGLNVLVGRGVYTNTNESAAFSATNIIDDDALILHVDPSAGVFGASAGKTFTWAPGGGAGTIYRDPSRHNHSDVFQHKEQWDQKATATDLGYFFADVV